MVDLKGVRVGCAMTGSFCTFKRAFGVWRELAATGAELMPIMSFNAAGTDTRFYEAADAVETFQEICGRPVIRTLAQVPEPKCVVSLGSCPKSGNVFKGSYSVEAPLDDYVHVDVSVAGCTPKPEAIMEGLYKAAQILQEKREAMHK